MRRLIVISLTLACSSLLAGLAFAVDGPDESELAEQVKAHINERMYETCKSVVLTHETNSVYRGYAEFLNGVRVDLEASVSDNAIRTMPSNTVFSDARNLQPRRRKHAWPNWRYRSPCRRLKLPDSEDCVCRPE